MDSRLAQRGKVFTGNASLLRVGLDDGQSSVMSLGSRGVAVRSLKSVGSVIHAREMGIARRSPVVSIVDGANEPRGSKRRTAGFVDNDTNTNSGLPLSGGVGLTTAALAASNANAAPTAADGGLALSSALPPPLPTGSNLFEIFTSIRWSKSMDVTASAAAAVVASSHEQPGAAEPVPERSASVSRAGAAGGAPPSMSGGRRSSSRSMSQQHEEPSGSSAAALASGLNRRPSAEATTSGDQQQQLTASQRNDEPERSTPTRGEDAAVKRPVADEDDIPRAASAVSGSSPLRREGSNKGTVLRSDDGLEVSPATPPSAKRPPQTTSRYTSPMGTGSISRSGSVSYRAASSPTKPETATWLSQQHELFVDSRQPPVEERRSRHLPVAAGGRATF